MSNARLPRNRVASFADVYGALMARLLSTGTRARR